MSRPASRVLTLLELLQSGGTRTSAELADRLGVDGRTVRRYVDHLITDLDVPVESVRGRYGGYRIMPGYRHLPPLMLSDDEALAVLLGLIAGRRTGLTTAVGTAHETATAKIRRVLPTRLARRLETVLDAVSFTDASSAPEDTAPDAEVLLALADAVRNQCPVSFGYTDREGVRSERTLHPYGIVSHENRWYVVGLNRSEERTFRMDRVAGVRALRGTFERPAGFDPAQQVVTGFATAAYRHEVTLRIRGTVEQIRTRLPASVATIHGPEIHGSGAEALRVELHVESLDWLPAVLASLDLPFTIERAPDELRERILGLADRLAAAARDVGGS